MATTTTTNETRIIFTLRDEAGTGFKQRTITIPGAVATSQTIDAVLSAFKTWRNYILNGATQLQNPFINGVDLRQFIQPTNWRDETGSTETTDMDTYTTTDIEIEFFTQEKMRYGADDLPT